MAGLSTRMRGAHMLRHRVIEHRLGVPQSYPSGLRVKSAFAGRQESCAVGSFGGTYPFRGVGFGPSGQSHKLSVAHASHNPMKAPGSSNSTGAAGHVAGQRRGADDDGLPLGPRYRHTIAAQERCHAARHVARRGGGHRNKGDKCLLALEFMHGSNLHGGESPAAFSASRMCATLAP
jgi:hypothetical protein